MTDKLYRRDQDLAHAHDALGPIGTPGKVPVTARLHARTTVLRVEHAAADRAPGPRDDNGVAADADEHVARAAGSSGAPLPDELRDRFEASLGADLSGVRVHTGSESATAARSVGARAYTTGQDIHFGEGNYDPSSAFGVHLIAHEVAHTVQQAGGPPVRQHKLEVSTPGDAAEAEADRAADAMVAGLQVALAIHGGGAARRLDRDVDYRELQAQGDVAQAAGMKAQLSIDNASVQADMSRSHEIIADIDTHLPMLREAYQDNDDVEDKWKAISTSTATKANLSIFSDRLDTSNVDTASFAVQFRQSNADYLRLHAEASQFTAKLGLPVGDAIADVGNGFAHADLTIDESKVDLDRFRAARNNLYTSSKKMDSALTKARGAASQLQGAIYKARAAAAKADGEKAAMRLAAVRAEIAAAAAGVGSIVKIASGVAGLAGGGGATNALAAPREEGGSVDIDPGRSGLAKGGTVFTEAESTSRTALMEAMGSDLASVFGDGGGPVAIAEALVTAIGVFANKDKIATLQTRIIEAAAIESTFQAAGDASSFVGYQEQMEGASKELANLIEAFQAAKKEMSEASQALMAKLDKGGTTGKHQAKGVMFLSDAERFLAQVRTAISVGEHQQANIKKAADDRKALRGTTSTIEREPDRETQVYWRCRKWADSDHFSLEKVDVTFGASSTDYNGIVQGGSGSVEGAGGASDLVATQLTTLKQYQAKVGVLQAQVQASLGLGGPVMQA